MATLEARASLRTTIPQLAYLPVIFLAYGFLLGEWCVLYHTCTKQ